MVITKATVLPLAMKYKDRIGNPDVKRITEELVEFPKERHYKRVAKLTRDFVWIWSVYDKQ